MLKNKIIINFCPTGMIPQKSHTPYVPISVQEIVEQTHEAYEAGITIAHLHARESDETPSWRPEIYRDIFEGVRKHCPGLVICGSTSGRLHPEFEKRSAVIELMPDMCSLTPSSLNFLQHSSVNDPDMIQGLALKMKDFGVNPELECFDLGMINYGKYLIKKGVIESPCYWNLIFGNIAGFQPVLTEITAAVTAVPDHHFIAFGGLGTHQLRVNSMAVALGYGVRIGLEDNIWRDKSKGIKARNIDLIQRIHKLMDMNDAEYMPPEEFGEAGFYNSAKSETLST
jgi:3-keto-5-aminohexanoate cleavage enzyme